jgi:tetratricopeptide (TPR) repeat protein
MRGLRSHVFIAAAACLIAATGCSKDPEVAKREYLQSGNRYVSEKKFNEAVVEYRNAIQQDARFGEARFKLAETYVQLGDASNAYREYVRAADLLPDDATAQIKATQMLLLAGEYETAKARIEPTLAKNPQNIEAQILRANALAGLKDFDAAVSDIEAAIKLDPERSISYANLGNLQLARGDRAEAGAAFRKAVETDPRSVVAQLALANFHWSAGEMEETKEAITAALALDPRHLLANRAMAMMLMATNQAPQAEPYLKAVVEISNASEAKLSLADYYRQFSREADARKILDDLRDDAASYTPVRLRLASMALAANDPAGAGKLVDEVVRKNPNDVAGLLAQAKLLVFERRFDEALEKAEAAVAIDARSANGHFLIGTMRMQRQEWDEAVASFTTVLTLVPRALNARLELVRALLAKGDREQAVQTAREAVTLQPRSGEARLALTRALLAKADAAGAEPHVNLLLANFPSAASVQTQQGLLLLQKKNPSRARQSFERALEIDAQYVDAIAGLVMLDLDAGRPQAARARVESSLAAAPQDARLLILAARTFAAIKDRDGAEQALRKALDVDPSNLQVYSMLGQLYAASGRLDEARAEFDRLAALRPKSVSAQTMAAMITHMQNKSEEARSRYEKIIEFDPQAAVAANNLAWLYAEGGHNLDVALQLAQTAKAKLPDHPDVNDTLGWIYYKKDLASLAIKPLQESIAAAPTNPTYHYHLGLAYAKAGDIPNARRSLDRALKHQPTAASASEIRSVLAALQ